MLLFIAFMCFAVLLASWLVMPDSVQADSPTPAEQPMPETGAIPARV